MAQLPDPRPTFDAAGWAVYNELAGPRGGVGAMYLTLLNHPPLAQHIGQLGTFLRFAGLLPGDLRELAILATARSLGVAYEWQQHVPTALQAGLSQDIVDQLQRGDIAGAQMSTLYADVWQAARHVAAQECLPEALQQRLLQSLGLKGVVELVALCGFYRCIATVVTAFDVAPADPGPTPF